jgi:hypothetical protein
MKSSVSLRAATSMSMPPSATPLAAAAATARWVNSCTALDLGAIDASLLQDVLQRKASAGSALAVDEAPRTAILQRADAERIAAGNDQTLVTRTK